MTKRQIRFILSVAIAAFSQATVANAQFEDVFAGTVIDLLAPGQQYQRLFVISQPLPANPTIEQSPPYPSFAGAPAADYFATIEAFTANYIPDWDGIATPYHAVVSDGAVNVKDRLAPYMGGPVFNGKQQLLARSTNELWSGQLLNSPAYDIFGNSTSNGSRIWTGSNGNGTTTGATANGWTDPNATATFGSATATDGSRLNAGTAPSSGTGYFYGIGSDVNFNMYTYAPAFSELIRGDQYMNTSGRFILGGISEIYSYNNPGSQSVVFSNHHGPTGTVTGNFFWPTSQVDLQANLGAGYDALNFRLVGQNLDGSFSPGSGAQIWTMHFDQVWQGDNTITLSYSSLLTGDVDPSLFRIFEFVDGSWRLAEDQVSDVGHHNITFHSHGLDTYALGMVPEPGTFALLATGVVFVLALARRKAST